MPAKKAAHFPRFNLIPVDPFYETPIGKASVWALRVGRYIVIFTEIIVILSFISRFKLDRDLTDLNTSIVQKTAVVQSYGEVEKQIRLIQKKSEEVNKLLVQNDGLVVWEVLISKIPFDVKLSRLGYTPTEIQLNGTARSSTSFSLFLQSLQAESRFREISIDQIATGDKRDPGIAFAIRLKIGNAPATPLTPQTPRATAVPADI